MSEFFIRAHWTKINSADLASNIFNVKAADEQAALKIISDEFGSRLVDSRVVGIIPDASGPHNVNRGAW